MSTWDVMQSTSLGSDHFPIFCELGIEAITEPRGYLHRWNFDKADWKKFSEICELRLLDWTMSEDLDICNDELCGILYRSAEESIPVKKYIDTGSRLVVCVNLKERAGPGFNGKRVTRRELRTEVRSIEESWRLQTRSGPVRHRITASRRNRVRPRCKRKGSRRGGGNQAFPRFRGGAGARGGGNSSSSSILLRGFSRMSEEENPAAEPLPVQDVQGDGRWMSQHNRFVQECKDAEPDVLFVGDSMVQLMQQYEVWRELFSPLHALNFGIGGDTTNNVLWRLQNGELENIRPRVVVLWVGTNNHEHTAEQVTGGIVAIVQLLHSRLPKAKIVVLGLLPRGELPNPLREKNSAVNNYLRAALPRLGPVQFLDVSGGFVHSDGTVSCRDMFDFLHLTASGYSVVATPLHELLLQLLEETPQERRASLV